MAAACGKLRLGFFLNERWEGCKKSNEIPILLMGINDAVFNKLDWYEGKCTWEDFSGGKYVIANVSPHFFNTTATSVLSRRIFHIKTTIIPCLLMIPVLLNVALAVPVSQFKKISRESVVERIRQE